MDLKFMGASPTEAETSALDRITETLSTDNRVLREGKAVRDQRHLLLPALWALQAEVGWISRGGLDEICRRLSVPPAEAFSVATFYDLFSLEEKPSTYIRVCDDIVCRMSDQSEIVALMHKDFGVEGQSWETSPCLGRCEQESAALVQNAGGSDYTLAPFHPSDLSSPNGSPRATNPTPTAILSRGPLTSRIGVVDPTSLDAYRASGGYQALRRAFQIGPVEVIRELKDSGLVGRGGAAFPMGVKWEAVATAPEHPHFVIANADESEPGTFKDRVLMEGDPFSLVEALTIAGFATGSRLGYIYIRGEYPESLRALTQALESARQRGWLGNDVMGSGWDFDIDIRRGAGAYICGEETALMESIEGFRGEPRNKPPFPTQHGLFQKPTVINNVETLVNVLPIINNGGLDFASIGSGRSRGTKLMAVSGAVHTPGIVEVEFGATVAQVLDLAGGVTEPLGSLLIGGAAGSFILPNQIDTPLTFEALTEIGATLGSGAVVAIGRSVDMVDFLARIARFFRHESCGQCVPCREGTLRQEQKWEVGEWEELGDLDRVMRDASICGLGQTASAAIQSALKLDLV